MTHNMGENKTLPPAYRVQRDRGIHKMLHVRSVCSLSVVNDLLLSLLYVTSVSLTHTRRAWLRLKALVIGSSPAALY